MGLDLPKHKQSKYIEPHHQHKDSAYLFKIYMVVLSTSLDLQTSSDLQHFQVLQHNNMLI